MDSMRTDVTTEPATPSVAEAPPGLAEEVLRRTGVAVSFFAPDGSPAAGSASDSPQTDLGGLVVQAARGGADLVESNEGCVRAAWPLRVRDRMILVAAAEVATPDEAMGRRLLAAVADATRSRLEAFAVRTECDNLSGSLLQTFEEISLLHNLGEVLRINRPVTELLEYVCGELRSTVEAEAAAAFLPEAEGEEEQAVIAGRLPFSEDDLPRVVTHLLEGVGPDQVILINNHCQDDPALAAVSMNLQQVVLVPLAVHEGARGALLAVNRQGEEFGSPDAKLIRSTASVSAIFVENRRLYRELQSLMLDLVRALVSSVDAKDPYTCGHSERVAISCRRIAQQLHLGADTVEQVYLAGLLHDIGKIGTPEHILRKEGRLESEEWQIIKRHPEIGSRILAGIRKLDGIRETVLSHHERIDGKGYPAGLKGDAIPLLARIVGMADAFDAMTSNRPYRPMLPLEQVRREIESNIGTQFDAKSAQALLGLNLNRLMQEFADRPTSACIQ